MGEDEENFPLDVEVEGFGSYEFEGFHNGSTIGFRLQGSGFRLGNFRIDGCTVHVLGRAGFERW